MEDPHADGLSFALSQDQLGQYFERVGLPFAGDVAAQYPPTLETLKRIQRAQLLHIPFENLSIPITAEKTNNSVDEVRVSVDPLEIFEKLVLQHQRGGYCFELNGLLCSVLRTLGFGVRPLLSRVLLRVEEPTSLSHEVLLISDYGRTPAYGNADGSFDINVQHRSPGLLVDVGFGPHTLRDVVEVPGAGEVHSCEDDGVEHTVRYDARRGVYTVARRMDVEVLEKRDTANESEFEDLYMFDLRQVYRSDVRAMNFEVSYDPNSIFVFLAIVGRATTSGRKTLVNGVFSVVEGGRTAHRTVIRSPEELQSVLSVEFGVLISMEDVACLWKRVHGDDEDHTAVFV